MDLSNTDQSKLASIDERKPIDTWPTIERIRAVLELSDEQMADMFCLTLKQFRMLRTRRQGVRVDAVFKFLERINVGFTQFMTGEIDYPALVAQYHGNREALPDRYLKATFSRRRTSFNIVQFLEMTRGWPEVLRILRSLQVDLALFADPNAWVNINLITDICEAMHKSGYPDWYFYDAGKFSSHLSSNAIVKKKLEIEETPLRVYEKIIAEKLSTLFDLNADYSFDELEKHRCIIKVQDKKTVLEELGQKSMGSSQVNAQRAGVFASFPTFKGWPEATAQLISIEKHNGLNISRYEVNFEKAHLAQSIC